MNRFSQKHAKKIECRHPGSRKMSIITMEGNRKRKESKGSLETHLVFRLPSFLFDRPATQTWLVPSLPSFPPPITPYNDPLPICALHTHRAGRR